MTAPCSSAANRASTPSNGLLVALGRDALRSRDHLVALGIPAVALGDLLVLVRAQVVVLEVVTVEGELELPLLGLGRLGAARLGRRGGRPGLGRPGPGLGGVGAVGPRAATSTARAPLGAGLGPYRLVVLLGRDLAEVLADGAATTTTGSQHTHGERHRAYQCHSQLVHGPPRPR